MTKELEPLVIDNRRTIMGAGLSRRSVFKAAGAAGIGAAAAVAGTRGAAAQSTDWTQPGNNNHVIELQGTKAFADGATKIDYYGHCAFKITSPGGATVLFDPWRDDPSGAWGLWFKMKFPETKVDITMSTHTHFDHDAIDRPVSTMVLDRMVGRFEFADLKITGFADKHACLAPGWYKWTDALKEFGAEACPPNNVGHMDMVTYLVETGGIRTLIWGDNRPDPADAFWASVGRVDVLTIPVDGSQHILSYAQADAIIDRLKPKIVIPTHYLNEATTYTLSTLQPADEWVKGKRSYKLVDGPSASLTAKDIAGLDREVFHFGSHVATL
ncbi:Zn-dependent hydrolase [Azospirillum sp. RWY-5-1]|uniref:Zn-dependent hydrolase n=1 Tax=Azospirillum oleiclasticum TaxID=2735135 RepID=A0ABX2TIJ1_9PROT|nr:MBL fold metallo-hydrolase [Azospirillum oleiclasticum]NYZ16473.1 Zn-dependent hydrolase [Azospirillum oleiclasticum]NYZ24058.1 Zn-dependent hydrolase [Azospirillum oleiclasticum]